MTTDQDNTGVNLAAEQLKAAGGRASDNEIIVRFGERGHRVFSDINELNSADMNNWLMWFTQNGYEPDAVVKALGGLVTVTNETQGSIIDVSDNRALESIIGDEIVLEAHNTQDINHTGEVIIRFGDNGHRVFENMAELDAAGVDNWEQWFKENGYSEDQAHAMLDSAVSIEHVDAGQILGKADGMTLGGVAVNQLSIMPINEHSGNPSYSVMSTMRGYARISGDLLDKLFDADSVPESIAGIKSGLSVMQYDGIGSGEGWGARETEALKTVLTGIQERAGLPQTGEYDDATAAVLQAQIDRIAEDSPTRAALTDLKDGLDNLKNREGENGGSALDDMYEPDPTSETAAFVQPSGHNNLPNNGMS